MPYSEPVELLHMERTLQTVVNMLHDSASEKYGNKHSSSNNTNHQRFMELLSSSDLNIKNTESVQSNAYSRSEYDASWQIAELTSAWASSVYTFRWWWWSHSYPASNVRKTILLHYILRRIKNNTTKPFIVIFLQ